VAPSDRDWSALQDAIAGEVVLPESRAYELARKPAIANFHDARPRALALCGSARDVAEVISFAARFELPIAPRSGGHCFAGRSSTGGIVIDVTPMRPVTVEDGMATIGAGARLGEIYDALAGHGLALAAGCGPDVGIAGLTLGGGFGILGRKYGLTSDQLLSAEVVLADGRVVECDEHHDEDLFWALRGAGGGRFGVVTSLVFRTVREPGATTFHLIWPHTEAVAIIDAWQAWAPAAPDDLAASLLVTASADTDRPPLVHLFGAMIGSEGDAAGLLDELVARAGSDPASASRTQLPYREAKRHLAEHGPGDDRPGYTFSKSEYFRRNLPTEALAVLVENLAAGRVAGESRVLDFSPWGGAYTRVESDLTAFAHRDANFLLKHEVLVDLAAPDAARESARRWLARSWNHAHPWGTGGVYPNFPDAEIPDWSPAYHGTNLDRLRRIRARYDPHGLLR
jgi:FAD/FMN-containing dehydrogenase